MVAFLSAILTMLFVAAVLMWTLKQYFIIRMYAAKVPKPNKKRRKRIVYDDDLND